MGRTPKSLNRNLEELIDECGMPKKGLARRVVDRGKSRGLDLSYDHNSVRRWLAGEQPIPVTARLIAEILGEQVGRRVDCTDCGFNVSDDPSVGLEFEFDWRRGISSAATLYRSDVERRRALTSVSYSTETYPATAIRWLTARTSEPPVHRGRPRVGQSEVDGVRSMTRAFHDLDNRVGGGRIRSTVAQYLNSEVAPLLNGTYTEAVGRELFSVSAEMTKNVGWMAFDSEEHGIAQRYLVQALRMAKTAGDDALAAEILAAMGHQATYVGRFAESIDLARVAQVAAQRAGLPTLVAECLLVEAHGHAGRRDPRDCSGVLMAGTHAFERQGSQPPVWLTYFDEAYFAAKIAHCFRALGDDSETRSYAERSLQMKTSFVRGRAFNLLLLASAHADTDPESAIAVGYQALPIIEGLESKRSHSYLRDLIQRLKKHEGLPQVAAFRSGAFEVMGAR